MRIVGNKNWQQQSATPAEALRRGAQLDAMMKSLGVPDFQPRGVFRGPPAMFAAMDAERMRKMQEWLDEHTRPA